MERTDLMDGEVANRLRAGRFTRHQPDGECRRVQDDRMLWKRKILMRFANFTNIISVLSNAPQLIMQSRRVVGVPLGNRTPMTRLDGASNVPH
jgi:hypothetical protein